jgi:transposase InsO family protein
MRRRVTAEEAEAGRRYFTPKARLMLLDTWMRSKLAATEFAALVGMSSHTLYEWKRRFEARGPQGLSDGRRGGRSGSRLPETTRRAILMMKQSHPDWGEDRLHDVLARSEGYGASPGAIGRVLAEAGYVVVGGAAAVHEPVARRFEKARPNELWQTDLFTFLLRRENRRVHLVAFLDDYSRFVVGYGLHASASGALVREVLEASIANFGAPREVLTDNGTQYKTWRGTSAFTRLLERRGIRQVVAAPRHPQTLGKTERFWGTLWREMLERAVFRGIEEARARIGLFVDHYNFQRPHQGIGGLVPADRYFEAAAEVKAALLRRVAVGAGELARNGVPRKPFYLTGRVGDREISLHAEGEKVVLVEEGKGREEVDLSAPGRRQEGETAEELPAAVAVTAVVSDAADLDDDAEGDPKAPGTSALDAGLERLEATEDGSGGGA